MNRSKNLFQNEELILNCVVGVEGKLGLQEMGPKCLLVYFIDCASGSDNTEGAVHVLQLFFR